LLEQGVGIAPELLTNFADIAMDDETKHDYE
jgi:hypothetical protein